MNQVVDIAASVESFALRRHVTTHAGLAMLKMPEDLDRYRTIIGMTLPDIVVEIGTYAGGSARWFADLGLDVITIDIAPRNVAELDVQGVAFWTADSRDPGVADELAEVLDGRRVMVVLDGDHSANTVRQEIGLYGPLVSPGCYLVVEDGILSHASRAQLTAQSMSDLDGGPVAAVRDLLYGAPGWIRDVHVEGMHPVTHHPEGWWRRDAG